jgi:hypothetical protein
MLRAGSSGCPQGQPAWWTAAELHLDSLPLWIDAEQMHWPPLLVGHEPCCAAGDTTDDGPAQAEVRTVIAIGHGDVPSGIGLHRQASLACGRMIWADIPVQRVRFLAHPTRRQL